jgi:hypothetical protein
VPRDEGDLAVFARAAVMLFLRFDDWLGEKQDAVRDEHPAIQRNM